MCNVNFSIIEYHNSYKECLKNNDYEYLEFIFKLINMQNKRNKNKKVFILLTPENLYYCLKNKYMEIYRILVDKLGKEINMNKYVKKINEALEKYNMNEMEYILILSKNLNNDNVKKIKDVYFRFL